jgi:AbiV family abortive infection protein
MEARAIAGIMEVPAEKRARILAEGLGLLIEHVRELDADGEVLRAAGKTRGAVILDQVRGEEAAKSLILVDAMRLGWRNDAEARAHLRHFSNHVARGIYCEATNMSPATFGELRGYVEDMRRSHYLDGPNDADWSFRNEIEVGREEAFYVDYVKYDDGHKWVSPRDRYEREAWGANAAAKLVFAMERLGMFTEQGLQLIGETWNGVEIADSLHWNEHQKRSWTAIKAISAAGLFTDRATQDDVRVVYHKWTFPMGTLDLRKRRVDDAELRREKDAALRGMYLDFYGELG